MSMTLREKEKFVASQEKYWDKEKDLLEREYKIKAERKALKKKYKEKKEAMPNSKLLIWFLFINCTIIELFTILVIIKELRLTAQGVMVPDLSPLMALITTVVAEVIGFGVYSLKSVKENTEGGIVYETAMKQFEMLQNEDGSYG